MKKTLAVMLALVCVISLCACGANKELVGTYKYSELADLALEITLEIKDGKNAENTMTGEEPMAVQYKVDGEKFTLIDADGEYEGTYKDNTISVSMPELGELKFVKEG